MDASLLFLLQPLNNCMHNACASMVYYIAQFSTQDGMNVRYQFEESKNPWRNGFGTTCYKMWLYIFRPS